jgi:iron transport multicopper oxidase
MRLVSMSCDSRFQYSIDGHNMTIIEADGVETQPLTVNSLTILAGQRYSFVLNANQPVGNYRIRAMPPNTTSLSVGFDGGINSAILRYKGAPKAEPNTTQQTNLVELNDAQLAPLINPGAPGGSGPADVVLNLTLGFNGTGFQMNGSQFAPSNELPVLLQILSGAKKAQDLLPKGSVYGLPLGKVIEINLIPNNTAGESHPLSLSK